MEFNPKKFKKGNLTLNWNINWNICYFPKVLFSCASFNNLTIGPVSPERLENYDQVLLGILRRHKFIQFYVSNAVLDFKHHMTSENSRELTRKIPFFLNRFFTNRASARMLIHQYRKYMIGSKLNTDDVC